MIQESELSPEAQQAVDRIEKLLRLAARNPNEAEAASAVAKAQELMAAYNLDQSTVEQNSGDAGKRTDEKIRGGKFEWEQDLWRRVARLNFCQYFSLTGREKYPGKWIPKSSSDPAAGFKREIKWRVYHQHRVVGRTVNTRTVKMMAEYLEQAIERITLEACFEHSWKEHGQSANSFREGMAESIGHKLYLARREQMAEEQRKAEETLEAARQAGMASTSTETALTISTMADQEHDANMDFIHGEGWSARQAAEEAARQAAQAARREAADRKWTQWCEDNPEEARRLADEQRKEREKQAKREAYNASRRTGRISWGDSYKGDSRARSLGNTAGESVSIWKQAGRSKSSGSIG